MSWKRTSEVELLRVALAVVVLWCCARSAAEHSTPIILLPCRTVQSLVGLPLVSAQRSADLVSQGGFHHAMLAHVRCGTPRALRLLSSFTSSSTTIAALSASFCHRRPTVTKSISSQLSQLLLSPSFCILLCGVDLSHFSGQSKIGEMEARLSRRCLI